MGSVHSDGGVFPGVFGLASFLRPDSAEGVQGRVGIRFGSYQAGWHLNGIKWPYYGGSLARYQVHLEVARFLVYNLQKQKEFSDVPGAA